MSLYLGHVSFYTSIILVTVLNFFLILSFSIKCVKTVIGDMPSVNDRKVIIPSTRVPYQMATNQKEATRNRSKRECSRSRRETNGRILYTGVKSIARYIQFHSQLLPEEISFLHPWITKGRNFSSFYVSAQRSVFDEYKHRDNKLLVKKRM